MQALLLDNTNVKRVFETGIVACLERKQSTLHHNELLFRTIFKKVDGRNKCPNKFSARIGQKVSMDFHLNPQVMFTKIDIPVKLLNIPSEVIKDLSHDQRSLLEYILEFLKDLSIPYYSQKSWTTEQRKMVDISYSNHGLVYSY